MAHATAQTMDTRAEGQHQRFVGKPHLAVVEAQAVDIDKEAFLFDRCSRHGRFGCARRRRLEDFLEIDHLVLVDDQLGIERVQTQLADVELFGCRGQTAGAEVLPSQQHVRRSRLVDAQVAHGKIATIHRALAIHRQLSRSGYVAAGKLHIGLAGDIGLSRFQREIAQLELEIGQRLAMCTCRRLRTVHHWPH